MMRKLMCMFLAEFILNMNSNQLNLENSNEN